MYIRTERGNDMIKVAVLGYGTVGSGVVEVIETNKELLNKRVANEMEVKYILDLRDFPGDPYEAKVIHDFDTIVNDEEVNIVCETMGGVGAAYKFTKACLEKGKSVCTSNKELVASHGPELLTIAKANNCSYLFEASVGGGIPIIRPLNDALTAERVDKIVGILNGTTNYMLTKMEKEGADYDDVLKKAQAMGYAEADPTADVGGHDACRKISILSSLMTTENVDSEKIYTEGITKITSADFAYAKEANMTIKLLASSTRTESGAVAAMVAPTMIGSDHPLYMVNDVFNAVMVTGNMVGDTMFYGKGAGKLPTASAVVGDVVECAKTLGKNVEFVWSDKDANLADIKDTERAFFVRGKIEEMDAVLSAIPGGEVISVPERADDFGYFTPVMKEKDFDAKCEALKDAVLGTIRLA